MKFKKILLSLLICLSCFVQAKNITISRLTCEMQEGLVVVEGSPRLGWVMESLVDIFAGTHLDGCLDFCQLHFAVQNFQ